MSNFVQRVVLSARNVLELKRLGRLGEEYAAPYEIVDQGEHHRLRRYTVATAGESGAPTALLIPPLMLTAEVYDIAPDTSAVVALGAAGIVPFVVDFGAPEREEGGMARTLDDHVRAVVQCIERIRELTGKEVHVLGYSQGGMFAYQAAAYLRSEGIRSLVTFGSPIDIHKNLPAFRADVLGAFARFVGPALSKTIDRIEGLPGVLTSTAFKLVSTKKEIQHRLEFVSLLHDRAALVRGESRRRFLGGEGFVAWPGPALRAFVDEFIVHNRMLSGGFVIDGRTVTLADIRCPILAFEGSHDEIARPASIRAIRDAAPDAIVDVRSVPAGHFGIVVGARAMEITWSAVVHWIRAREASQAVDPPVSKSRVDTNFDELEGIEFDGEFRLWMDTVYGTLKEAWRGAGRLAAGVSDAYDAVRFQEPRLRFLAELTPDSRVSPALALADRARETPSAPFFLWHDRAFTYAEAERRVANVAKGLYLSGVRKGARVGVVMLSRPSFLSVVTALSRLGAVAVLVPPDAAPEAMKDAIGRIGAKVLVTDPNCAERCAAWFEGEVLVLGGGGKSRTLPSRFTDMEAINPETVTLPADLALDSGRAGELAMVLLRPTEGGSLRPAEITNHRWALSAYGASAACTLKAADTVYCCIPLHHPTGILVSAGGAMIGGARLALADGLDVSRFFSDVRRYGATVVFYAGEMLRGLLSTPPSRADRSLPIRLFAGSGIRVDLVEKLKQRFGVTVMEFYAGTTEKVILADASGSKPGALGRPLPGSSAIRLVRVDLVNKMPLRGPDGYLQPALIGEPGLLVVEVTADDVAEGKGSLVRGAFVEGDAWVVSSDVLRADVDGDHWFVDSLSGFVSTTGGPASTRAVEDALYALTELELAAAWPSATGIVAAVVSRESLSPARVNEALKSLPKSARPTQIFAFPEIPVTDGFRPRKGELAHVAHDTEPALRIDEVGLYRK